MKNKAKHLIAAISILGALVWSYYKYSQYINPIKNCIQNSISSGNTMSNYSFEVKSAALEFDLPFPFLMALIQLECGGKKPAGSRYEKHVFKSLKDVRDGHKKNYENITQLHLADASDEALKNLATSWGPFQLMGYKCILLGVKIKDIRGPRAVYYGAKWIDLAYGKRLRNEQFKDCFHIHNTGKPYPSNSIPITHDPQYVPRGMAAIEMYKNASE